MIIPLPVDIQQAGLIIVERRPLYVFFRSVGGVVVEACCCDTEDEARILAREYGERPGEFCGYRGERGKVN